MIRLENINKFYTSGNERIHVIRNLNYTFPDTGLVFIHQVVLVNLHY